MRVRLLWLAFCLGISLAMPSRAVTPLAELLASVPAPPGDVDVAAGWVRDGKLAAPEVLDFESRLNAQKLALAPSGASASVQTGAAASPDSAAVAAALAGYKAYFASNSAANDPAKALSGRMNWLAQRFGTLKQGISDVERVADLRKQELAAYGALFADWKSKRAPLIQKAHRELAAAGELAVIQSAENRTALQQYGLAMISELETLFGLTRHAVETAAGIAAPVVPAKPGRPPSTLWDLMANPPKKAS